MRCPVLLLLVTRVAWGATSSPSSPSAGEPALQTPGAPDLLQPDSPRKVSHHNHPDPDPDAQAAPSILDIFPQDLLTSRCLYPEITFCLHHTCVPTLSRLKTALLLDLRSRIKPLDIRRIEHDHFIDYEVELVSESFSPSKNHFAGRVRRVARRGE